MLISHLLRGDVSELLGRRFSGPKSCCRRFVLPASSCISMAEHFGSAFFNQDGNFVLFGSMLDVLERHFLAASPFMF
jgi:hypothetical protein